MLSFLTTLLTCSLAVSGAAAMSITGLRVSPRAAYTPAIVSPDANTIWAVGKDALISWDATQVPKDADKIASVGLYNTTADGAPDALLVALASSFEPARGAVSVTVPPTVAPGSYVVKIGDNASSKFTIVAEAVAYLPPLAGIDENTVWTVGKDATVSWDTSAAPANAAQLQYLDLYTSTPSGGSLFVARLACNLDVKTGKATVTVPQARSGKYFVMLGKYGHNSAQFTIKSQQ